MNEKDGLLLLKEYAGDIEFETFLVENDIPITVWEIRSFVLGVVLGPEFLQPSWVLEEILLQGTDDEIEFESEKQFHEFLKRFFSLWNELAGIRKNVKSFPLSRIPRSFGFEDCVPALSLRDDELNNFLAGLGESGAIGLEEDDVKFHEAILKLETLVDQIGNCLEEIVQSDEEEGAVKNALEMIEHIDRTWKQYLPVIVDRLAQIN